jgi:GT2 family glycosyltransferase
MPRVSVVTATYNAGVFIEETIDALLRQTYPNFELIVIDDASHDDTLDRVQRFRDPRIRVIRNETNVGVARARNIGLEAATGQYVAANDHDDISLPTRLEKQVAFMDARPDVLMVGAGIYTLKDGRRMADRIPAFDHYVLRWLLMTHVPICHSTMFARLGAMRERQLIYDPSFDFGDDFDLYHRMATVGRLASLQERLVTYRVHSSNASIVRGDEMNVRGTAMLARAHSQYLGAVLPTDAFGSLWRVITQCLPARSLNELRTVGRALESLLGAYLGVTTAAREHVEAVNLAASEQWWNAAARSSYVLGNEAFRTYKEIPALDAYRPTFARRARQQIGRLVRTAVARGRA